MPVPTTETPSQSSVGDEEIFVCPDRDACGFVPSTR
jgi:hypothetical protein